MIDFRSYSELYHFGIKGMHWGIRRYQNPDGSLTPAGKKHYNRAILADKYVQDLKDDEADQKDIDYWQKRADKLHKRAEKIEKHNLVKDINGYNSGSPLSGKDYYKKHEKYRDKILTNEIVKEGASKIKDLKQKRDQEFTKMVEVQVKEYKDFLGAMNVVRNASYLKNHDMKNYTKGVQKYRNLANTYAKQQGWKSIEEKIANQGVGNIDDLWDELKYNSKEWSAAKNQYETIAHQFYKEADSLSRSMLKDIRLGKGPTVRQQNIMRYALMNAKM